MIPSFLDALFGCWHRRMSRVFSPLHWRLSYQVCLDCGTEFEYDLATMRRGKKIFRGAERPDKVTLERERSKTLRVVGRKEQPQPAAMMRAAKVRNIR